MREIRHEAMALMIPQQKTNPATAHVKSHPHR